MDTQEQTTPSSSTPANKPNSMPMILGIIALLVIGGGVFFFMNQKPQNTTQTPASPQPTEEQQPTTTTAPSETTQQDATTGENKAVKEFTVTGSNFSFTPAEIKVKKGDSVKIIFKNADGMHDFVIDEFEAKTEQINGGEQAEVTFTADQTGSFEYYCSVGKHRQMGMKGTLIVE